MSGGRAKRADGALLRRADLDDARAVAEVLIRSRKASVGSIPTTVHSDDEIREWIKAALIPGREVWLAESAEGRALAMLVLDGDWIDQLYVDPAWTGLGLGSRMVELAKSRRPAGLQLWTFVTNTGARRFYEHHGFRVAEMTDGSGNEEKEPDIRFIWGKPLTADSPDVKPVRMLWLPKTLSGQVKRRVRAREQSAEPQFPSAGLARPECFPRSV